MASRIEPRQYQDSSVPYQLPNDATEHERLDHQSAAVCVLMHNKPFHATPLAPKKILDVGCGTGTMTVKLAKLYPDAQVIGVDISAVPPIHEKPDNVQYVQGNVRELIRGADLQFAIGSFDYVFSRFLVLGMTDWPGYVDVVASLLKPGGWAELQDLEMKQWDKHGECISDSWSYFVPFRDALAAKGLDVCIGSKLADLMKRSKLEEVKETSYKWPTAPMPEQPETDMIYQHTARQQQMMQTLIGKVLEGRHTEEEIEGFKAEVLDILDKKQPGSHARMYVAIGQKSGGSD